MKKTTKITRVIAMALAVFLLAGCLGGAAFASGTQRAPIRVFVNDAEVVFPDTQPVIDANSRTLIPVRFMSEAMGADVEWDDANKCAVISKDGTEVRLKFNDKNMVVKKGGSETVVVMDTEAVNIGDRTMVPVRYVAEALGAYVDYSNLYSIAEIVTSDELTAEEIGRLRSYDLIQWFHTDRAGDEWFTSMEEYKYFKDTPYWFSNSHNFLRTYDKTLGLKARSLYTKYYCEPDTTAYTYMQFVVQHVNHLFELESLAYNPEIEDENYGTWTYHEEDWFDATYNFRTCTNLVYQQVCPPLACTSVRGVLDMTFGEDTPLQWIADSFGIKDPEHNKTYSLDIEVIITVNGYSHLNESVFYYFDADGTVHELDKKPVKNYH